MSGQPGLMIVKSNASTDDVHDVLIHLREVFFFEIRTRKYFALYFI